MKTVTGRVISAEPISLSKAATLLSGFASSDNGATQDVSAYLRQASAAFTKLKSFHREIKSKATKPSSEARREQNVTGEFDGGKIRDRKSEAVSEESVYGREHEDKKNKKKKNKDEDVIDEKVNEKLEDEERSEERKERKKKKEKKKIKSEEEMGVEVRKSKKKRKNEEMGSEKKGKKKRKSREIDD